MKPLYLLHIFVTCTVATNVSASCKDHLKERLPTLLDAGDGARYLANPIPTDWPQCAINGTSDPFAVGTDGTKVQFTDDFISPNTNFYCSKVYPNDATQGVANDATFLLCIPQDNIPQAKQTLQPYIAPYDRPAQCPEGPENAECMNNGTKPSETDLYSYDMITIDCKEVANAAQAMFKNCGDIRDDQGQAVMGGVQPIAADGSATGLQKIGGGQIDAQSKPASGMFLQIKYR